MRVLVGISGGPRSLVTAWLLKKQGMQVRGLHLDLSSGEGSRERMLEIERKLGIQVQILEVSKTAGPLFLEEQTRALLSGQSFSAKLTFQKKILLPELLRMGVQTGAGRIATGHEVSLQEDPAAGVVRVVRGSSSSLDALLEILGLNQESLSRWIAPIGAIPKTLLDKLIQEVSLSENSTFFEPDWKSLEARMDSSDPALRARELQVYTNAGVLLGRAPLGSIRSGQRYQDPENPDQEYRVVDVQPKSDRVLVQPASEILLRGFHFDEVSWFSRSDPGMGVLDVGMISSSSNTPRSIRLIQFEGDRLKGVLSDPLRGADANLFKGDHVLFLQGAEVLGGARIIGAE